VRGVAGLVGAVLAIGLVIAYWQWVVLVVLLAVVVFCVVGLVGGASRRQDEREQRAAEQRRAEIESRAEVDVAGYCGWCGDRAAEHLDRGRYVAPRLFHADEIEETIAASAARA
jgi:hypothetical protein